MQGKVKENKLEKKPEEGNRGGSRE